MKYNNKMSKELFNLFSDCKLVDILPDSEGYMMFVFDNGKTLRGLTFENGGYQVQSLKKVE